MYKEAILQKKRESTYTIAPVPQTTDNDNKVEVASPNLASSRVSEAQRRQAMVKRQLNRSGLTRKNMDQKRKASERYAMFA